MTHKPRSLRRQRALNRHHRRAARAARKSNKERARKAVKTLEHQTDCHLSRLQRLEQFSAQTRAKYATQHKQAGSAPIRVLPPPPVRFMPEWSEWRKRAA